jgi:hypothetical protein
MLKLPLSLHLLTLLLGLGLALPAHANSKRGCAPAFQALQSKLGAKNFDYQNSHLWNYTFKWENTHNFATFRENPDTVMAMKLVQTPPNEVEVISFSAVDPRLLAKFSGKGSAYWPIHPNNTSTTVPYMNQPQVATLETRYTASRSLLSVEPDTPAFTIKAGTDFPHMAERQTAKASTRDDVNGALLRQPFINAVAKALPEDDLLVTLPEVLVLKHRASGEGVLIRDLSQLDSPDRIYVTGLSIPYVGREIAEKNGTKFAEFWTKNYSENLGRAKARLLIKYGLEMETPNSQNILIELTKDFQPTGRVVLRDTVDSYAYGPWLRALGMKNVEAENIRLDYKPKEGLDPFPSNSHWRFDEAGRDGFTGKQVEAMNEAHNKAWLEEVKELLSLQSSSIKSISEMDTFLKSETGQNALRSYHERIGTLPKLQEIDQTLYPRQGLRLLWRSDKIASLFYLPNLGYSWA